MRNLIRQMAAEKTIVFTTHILQEVEAMCSRVIMIERGRIVANGTPEELKARSELAGAVHVCAQGLLPGPWPSVSRRRPGRSGWKF